MLFFDNFYYYLLRVRLLELMSDSNCLPCPQFGKVAARRTRRCFLLLPASLGFRLACPATGGARLRPHYQDCRFVR